MPTVTLKLTAAEHARLKAEATRRRTTKSAVLREAIARQIDAAPATGSFYERAKHLIGAASGPGDLSTNPEYMAGYGKSRHS
ncbi:MAG: hypothetical protein KIT44_07395 [Opitutaceae bacterium]|nr:hypothetical protein [Opitutaceae bacterium]